MTKTALITGGTRGIGKAIARDLVDSGWQVTILGRSHVEDFGAHMIECDLRVEDDVKRASELHIDKFGDSLDLLVNCAGVAIRSRIEDQNAAQWDMEFGVNVKGAFLVFQSLRDSLIKAHGLTVNIGSISSFEGSVSMPAYSASKHALLGLTRSINKDPKTRATIICPGYVNTDMTDHVGAISGDEMIQPSDIAKIVQMLLALSAHAHIPQVDLRRI